MFTIGMNELLLRKTFARNAKSIKEVGNHDIDRVILRKAILMQCNHAGSARDHTRNTKHVKEKESTYANVIKLVFEVVNVQVSGGRVGSQHHTKKAKYTSKQLDAEDRGDVEDYPNTNIINPQVNGGQIIGNHIKDHIDNVQVAGAFAYSHHLTFNNAVMNDYTAIQTQNNIYNLPEESPPLSPIGSTIPCTSRNFVGQEAYLERLRKYFTRRGVDRKIFVLHGMGGIGKTQICLKFIDDMAETFAHIFWIDSTSEDTVVKSLRDTFKEISPPGTPADSFSAKAALHGISKLTSKWLIIYDNADGAPELVESFLPPGNKGNVLITSRNPAHRRLASPESSMEIMEMSNESAIDLILKASGSDVHARSKRKVAQEIVNELNHLPLALDMGGAYIMQTQCHIEDFLGMYKKYRPKILDNNGFKGASTYNKTVYKTWELSFESLLRMTGDTKNKNKADAAKYAMTLINLSAFFHHDNISYAIFEQAAKHYKENTYHMDDIPTYLTIVDKTLLNMNEKEEWDDHIFYESISLLLSFSLIKKTMNSKMYAVHPLVQSYCQDRLSAEEKKIWILNAQAVIVSSVSESSSDRYIYQNTLLPHLLKNLDQHKIGINYYDDLHKISARMLHNAGMYAVEEKYRLKVVNVHLGNLNVKTTSDIVSNLKKIQESYLERDEPTAIYKKLESAVDCVVDLTNCYCHQLKWADAEPLQVMALSMLEKILGKDHPKTLRVKNNLANTYRNQGKLTAAEKVQINLLSAWERVLGEKHPASLSEMNDLASAYQHQGKLTDAERMQIGMQERILGKAHPYNMSVYNNLANTYQNQGKLVDAEQLHIEVLSLREKHLGKEHPQTLRAMHDLANTYQIQGKWSDAEQLLKEVLSIQERIFGMEHPETCSVMNDLANTYLKQGKLSDAEPLQNTLRGMITGMQAASGEIAKKFGIRLAKKESTRNTK